MSCKTPFSNGESERGSTACLRSENWWVNRLGVGTCLSGLGPCALSTKLPRCPPPCGIAHEFVHCSLPVIKSFSLALGTFYFLSLIPFLPQPGQWLLKENMVAWKSPWWPGNFLLRGAFPGLVILLPFTPSDQCL